MSASWLLHLEVCLCMLAILMLVFKRPGKPAVCWEGDDALLWQQA